MATSIGDLALKIHVNSTDLGPGLRGVQHQLAKFGGNNPLFNAPKGSPMGGGAGGLGALSGLALGVTAISTAFNALATAAGMAYSAVSTVASVAWNVGSAAVQASADFEQMRIAFGVMTGSEAAGDALLQQVTDIAAASPLFTFDSLASGTQRLMAMGFAADETLGVMTRLGNIAAGSGKNFEETFGRIAYAVGQVKSANKLYGTEVRQLAEAGVNMKEALAQRFGVTSGEVEEMITAGKVNAEDAIGALMTLAEGPKFGGLAEKRGRGVAGLQSALADNQQISLRKFGDVLVDSLDIKGWLTSLIDLFKTGGQYFATWTPVLNGIGVAMTTLRDIGFAMLGGILPMVGELGGGFSRLVPTVTQIKLATIDFAQAATQAFTVFGYHATKVGGLVAGVMADVVKGIAHLAESTSEWAKHNPLLAARLGFSEAAVNSLDRFAASARGGAAGLRALATVAGALDEGDLAAQLERNNELFAGFRAKAIAASDAAGGALGFGGIMAAAGKQGGGLNLPGLNLKFPENKKDALALVKDTKSPLEKFENRIADINKEFDAGAINADVMALNIMGAVEELEKGTGKGLGEIKTAGVDEYGSTGAFSAINAFRLGGDKAQTQQERVIKIIEQQKALQKQQLDAAREVADAVRRPNVVVFR